MSIAPIRRRGSPSAIAETAAYWVLRQEDSGLCESDEERFAAWLAEDLAHVEAYEDAIWALDVVAHHAGEAPIRALRETALTARGAPLQLRWLGAGAGALAASFAAFLIFLGQPFAPDTATQDSSGVSATADPNNATYRTQIGERLAVTLPDSSVVTLDTDSEVRVAYSAGERTLNLLRGQALFEVAHGRPRPFRVTAAGREILAVGTAFNVRIDGVDLRVALLEGTVKVRSSTSSAGGGEITMRAGETLQTSDAGTAIRAIDVGQMANWRSGELVFNDARLADAVAEINRYTLQPITVEGSTVGNYRISGVFRTNDPERFSRAMSEILPVEFVRHEDGALALRSRSN